MVWRPGGNTENVEDEPRWAARIFVAATNTNSVYAVGVSQDKELRVVENINVSMTPRQPLGMSPSGLGLSEDGQRLYVACSDANAVAVVDLTGDRSYVKGFIPVGWYPTAARVLPSGTLVVLNGKGVRSYPNPHGPNPARRPELVHAGVAEEQYVAHMQTGTASWIPPFTEGQLEKWTAAALADSPYRDSKLDETSPLPHIEHVIYMKEGNGDPSLELFDENSTPNLHKLAREFVLLDNFYVNADVSADGHNWSTAAIAPDYVVKLWPNNYARRGKEYDFEEQDQASLPPAGYLWTNASLAGRSIRNFGYMVNEKRGAPLGADQITGVRDPVLAKVTNWKYQGFDLSTPDVDRAQVFLREFAEYEKSGNMPELIVMRLPNDHTSGTKPGALTPRSMAADNDYALGMIAEAVSKSKFWTSTAIFVVEDDAQNGPDHVDSHRSPAWVISSFGKRHLVDSTMYNTASVLRTMEFLLGVKPMTHFDAGARPMTSVFQSMPDATPYTAEQPRISLTGRNPANGPGAEASIHMDFDEADKNDDDELNDVLWRAIRPGNPPPPARSFFGK
jgi:DNA-binding beta-propeller fold protein YncE